MSRRFHQRIYWRERGGDRRAYAEFRDYADVGGGREALVPEGQKLATTDPDAAAKVMAERLEVLDAKRHGLVFHGAALQQATLGTYAEDHLVKKATGRRAFDPRWLRLCELHLTRACEFFGYGRGLQSLGVPDVQRWMDHLGKRVSNRRLEGQEDAEDPIRRPITGATIGCT